MADHRGGLGARSRGEARSGRVRLHRRRRGRRVDDAGEPRRVRRSGASGRGCSPGTSCATSRSTCSGCIRRGRSSSRRSGCSRSPTKRRRWRSARRRRRRACRCCSRARRRIRSRRSPRRTRRAGSSSTGSTTARSARASCGGPRQAGYGAIVVTLDTLTLGWRPRDLRQAYLPFIKRRGLRPVLLRPGVPVAARQAAAGGSAHRRRDDARDLPEPRSHLGRPRLAARADEAAAARQGRADRRRRAAGARARDRRDRRLEPRRPAGRRRGRGARRARRGPRRACPRRSC